MSVPTIRQRESSRQKEAKTSFMLCQSLIDASAFSHFFMNIHAPSNSGPTSLPSRELPSGKTDRRPVGRRTKPLFGYLLLSPQKCIASPVRSPKHGHVGRCLLVGRLDRRAHLVIRLRQRSGKDVPHCKIHRSLGRRFLRAVSLCPPGTKWAHRRPRPL